MHYQGKRWVRAWFLPGASSAAVLCAAISASFGQGLPSGGGPVPPLRRGANGQIEIVPPSAPAHPELGRRGTGSSPQAAPIGSTPHRAAPAARVEAPPGPAQPVITVAPVTPHVPDTAPPGAVVATYSVRMSDGSPFSGTVRFGAPYYDAGGIFALSGDKIIVSLGGPRLGPNKSTITKHITLEAIP